MPQATPLGFYPAPVTFFQNLKACGWASACKLMNRDMIGDGWKGIVFLIHEAHHFYFAYWAFEERFLCFRDSMKVPQVSICMHAESAFPHMHIFRMLQSDIDCAFFSPFPEVVRAQCQRPAALDPAGVR